MRKALIILAVLLAMTGLAYAVAPLVAPIPPGAVGPPIVPNAPGSVSGTSIHSDITDDIGIIVDGANDLAYKSWWVHHPYAQVGSVVAGAMASELAEKIENGVGFSSWISAKWNLIKEKLGPLGQLENYPILEGLLSPFYEAGAPPPPLTVGQTIEGLNGGFWQLTIAQTAFGQALPEKRDVFPDCPASPNEMLTYPQKLPGQTQRVYCITGKIPPPSLNYYQSYSDWKFISDYTGDIEEDWPVYPPGVWNPAVDAVLNDPAVQTDPAVKEELGQVIADNPDVLNPILDKLTAANLAAAVAADKLALASQNIQDLMDKVAADPTNIEAQIAFNNALAEQATAIQEPLEEQAALEASTPEIAIEELRSIDWTPLTQLIGISCKSSECPFPFDFIYALENTFDEFTSDTPSMPNPGGSYGLDGFKINFNFDFTRFQDIMAKVRTLLSWIMTIYTVHKCVRIVVRDNASGDDD